MYILRVEGKDRMATFEIDKDSDAIKCVELKGMGCDPKEELTLPYGDCLNVTCWEKGQQNQVEDFWMVFHGTLGGILKVIDKEWPVAKMESDQFFKFFDQWKKEEGEKPKIYQIGYYLKKPSPVVGRSQIHRKMRSAFPKVVQYLYRVSKDESHMLPLNEADKPFNKKPITRPSWMEEGIEVK